MLKVIAGPDQGKTFTLVEGQSLAVGRGVDSDTFLHDKTVAPLHCHVTVHQGHVAISNQRTGEPLLVNMEATTSQELFAGDLVQIGETVLEMHWYHGDERETRETLGNPLPSDPPGE